VKKTEVLDWKKAHRKHGEVLRKGAVVGVSQDASINFTLRPTGAVVAIISNIVEDLTRDLTDCEASFINTWEDKCLQESDFDVRKAYQIALRVNQDFYCPRALEMLRELQTNSPKVFSINTNVSIRQEILGIREVPKNLRKGLIVALIHEMTLVNYHDALILPMDYFTEKEVNALNQLACVKNYKGLLIFVTDEKKSFLLRMLDLFKGWL
jgi:hypothetical protein